MSIPSGMMNEEPICIDDLHSVALHDKRAASVY